MKTLVLILLTFGSSVSHSKVFHLDKKILDGNSVPYLAHSGSGEWDNYQTMNLPFSPAADLFKQIVIKEKRPMTTRGEAHITVITPVEYWNILRPVGITIEEIQKISASSNIQNSEFKIICLGMSIAQINNKEEKTFYVVVESEDLISIRNKIQELYLSKGGRSYLFQPRSFYPHITIGYTSRDLHESDGVIKDAKSCVTALDLY